MKISFYALISLLRDKFQDLEIVLGNDPNNKWLIDIKIDMGLGKKERCTFNTRTHTVFGATDKIDQVFFDTQSRLRSKGTKYVPLKNLV